MQRAQAALAEALRLRWEDGEAWGTASVLSACGLSAVARGTGRAAVRLFAAAAFAAASETNIRPEYQADAERELATARRAVGEAAYRAAWQEGRALTPDQAVAEALALAAEPVSDAGAAQAKPEVAAPALPNGLSVREVEVLRLLAAGTSNREITDTLVLSICTIETHAARIYTKIGAVNRVEAAPFAVRHGLVSA